MLWTAVLEKTLESSLDSKEIKSFNLKEINPDYSLEGLMLKLKLQYFGHLMQRADSLEKTLMLGKIEGRRRRGWQRMRCLECKPTKGDSAGQGNLMCCSAWGHKVGHDWATEQQQQNRENICLHKVLLVDKGALLSTDSHTLRDSWGQRLKHTCVYTSSCPLSICSLFPLLTFPSKSYQSV